jgi:hypothetical protein
VKIKEITVGGSYTFQPQAYHSARGEASFTIELEEGDDLEQIEEEVRSRVVQTIVRSLAGVDEVHQKLAVQGLSPSDLVEQDPEDDILTGDEGSEWL